MNVATSIKLFALCENLKFTALPVAGGIYDQHPELIKQWMIILEERGIHEEENRRKQERENSRNKSRVQRR